MIPIDTLRQKLNAAGIPFESSVEERKYSEDNFKRYGEAARYMINQIVYGRLDRENWKVDAIFHYGSYGAKDGLLEVWGSLIGDEPVVMTVDEVFEIIQKEWRETKTEYI